MQLNQIIQGDSLEVLKSFDENSISTVICDPPYGLSSHPEKVIRKVFSEWLNGNDGYIPDTKGFMGKSWDAFVPPPALWREVYRVMKPGGTILCFAGSRTQDLMAMSLRLAGFEIKDTIMWLYSQGFPKSLNIEKSLQKKYKCGIMEEYEKETEPISKYNLRLMSKTNLQKTFSNKKTKGKILQSGLSEQGISIKREAPKSIQISNWGEEPSLERGDDIQASKRQLQGGNICEMPEGVFENGKERWLCNETSFSYGTTSWSDTQKDGGGSPYRPQPEQQRHKQPDAFSNKPSSQEIRKWDGYGSHSLKPSYEPIILAMKANDGSYAENALKYGVAGLNIDGGRIEVVKKEKEHFEKEWDRKQSMSAELGGVAMNKELKAISLRDYVPTGRFPSNTLLECICDEVIEGKHTNPDCPCYMLDEQSGISKSSASGYNWENSKQGNVPITKNIKSGNHFGDKGGASRFFYCAKASRSERNVGLEGMPLVESGGMLGTKDKSLKTGSGNERNNLNQNYHPTIKPLALMEYLVKLTSMPNPDQVYLDPFLGSGTTAMACKKLGKKWIGIELNPEYIEIAKKRIEAVIVKQEVQAKPEQ
jgi:DNA modification methylase